MKIMIGLALVAAIFIFETQGESSTKNHTTKATANKRFGYPPFGLHNFLHMQTYNRGNEKKDSDDDGKSYYNICPPEPPFPTRRKCREGSVNDKDNGCEIRTCIFYPTSGFTVRPSYLDLFNIPPYYRFMFSKKIISPSPYGNVYGGLGKTPPYFPQVPGFQQQQTMQFPPFAQQPMPPFQSQFSPFGNSFPPYGSQMLPPNMYNPSPGNNPGYNAYQHSMTPMYQQNFPMGFHSQGFPGPTGYQGQGPAPPPPPPPPPPQQKRSLFFGLPGQGVPGPASGLFTNQHFGGNPYGQPAYGQNPFGGGSQFGAGQPIIARYCKSPDKICECGSAATCKCSADKPKLCTQQYTDDGRFFWVYEWVPHSSQHGNTGKPYSHNAGHPQNVPSSPDAMYQKPDSTNGPNSWHQRSFIQPPQGENIDYNQPVQPMMQHQAQPPMMQHQAQQPMMQHQSQQPMMQHQAQQPMMQHQAQQPMMQHQTQQPMMQHQAQQQTGSYQPRQRFLFFQRPSGCECEVPKPNKHPFFG